TGALLSGFITDSQAAADETINLTQRAADMASVFNTSVPDALNAVQAAIRGESEPIRRFGVLLDDASVRARAVELGLAASTKEVGLQEKAMARLDLIYEQTAKTQGDFINTRGSIANQQKTLGAQLEDTKAKIGEALAPAMQSLLALSAELLPLFEDFGVQLAGVISKTEALVGPIRFLVDALNDLQGQQQLVTESGREVD
ncbi:MAG: hypothetical protein GY769_07575, partial [bacterium]|nr:hypothetical protein [bacterium]